jgi:hypothetical protein
MAGQQLGPLIQTIQSRECEICGKYQVERVREN